MAPIPFVGQGAPYRHKVMGLFRTDPVPMVTVSANAWPKDAHADSVSSLCDSNEESRTLFTLLRSHLLVLACERLGPLTMILKS
jgi:hypothetical protein